MAKRSCFFKSEVLEVRSECTHNGDLDLDEFCNKITGVWAAAQVSGVSQTEFEDVISECVPEAFGMIELKNFQAA